MFENLRQSTGLLAARYRFRKAQDKVISFSQIVSSAGTALCILPLDTKSFPPIAPVIDLLKARFGSENITESCLQQASSFTSSRVRLGHSIFPAVS